MNPSDAPQGYIYERTKSLEFEVHNMSEKSEAFLETLKKFLPLCLFYTNE
jgi:hypothetical protein